MINISIFDNDTLTQALFHFLLTIHNIMVNESDILRVKKANTNNAVFSIIIPTWNNLEYLQLCIKSIRKNSFLQHQIIIHINEGNDGTKQWVEQQPDIDFSFSEKNIGVCYALNSCRPLVETSYIVYMNDDMYACPGWDKALYDEIQKTNHPYFFFSSTAIEPFASSNCSIEKDFGSNIKTFNEQKLLSEFDTFAKKDWSGATWPPNVVHTNIWDLVGGYSIEFSPGMYSDPDFSFKLWKAGVRLFKGIEKSRVYHFGSVSVKRVNKNSGYYKFIQKWGITSGTFSKYYLHRGDLFNEKLQQPVLHFGIKAKSIFKQFKSIFYQS